MSRGRAEAGSAPGGRTCVIHTLPFARSAVRCMLPVCPALHGGPHGQTQNRAEARFLCKISQIAQDSSRQIFVKCGRRGMSLLSGANIPPRAKSRRRCKQEGRPSRPTMDTDNELAGIRVRVFIHPPVGISAGRVAGCVVHSWYRHIRKYIIPYRGYRTRTPQTSCAPSGYCRLL